MITRDPETGLRLGLPKWAEESSDPRIARIKELSYWPGVGYVFDHFVEMLVASGCRGTNMADDALHATKLAKDAEFDELVYGNDDALLLRAMEVYDAHALATKTPAPDHHLIRGTLEWRPSPEDVTLAMQQRAADELVTDAATAEVIREDDFGVEKVAVVSVDEAIADLQAYAGYGNSAKAYKIMAEIRKHQAMLERTSMAYSPEGVIRELAKLWKQLDTAGLHDTPIHPLSTVLATLFPVTYGDEEKGKALTKRQQRIVKRCMAETLVNDVVVWGEMRKPSGETVRGPRLIRTIKIGAIQRAMANATVMLEAEEAQDRADEYAARTDELAHPQDDDAKVHVSLDADARWMEWASKKTVPDAKGKVAKPWLAHPAYIAVRSHVTENGGKNMREIHNRAYAADTLNSSKRVKEYHPVLGFTVVLNAATGQTGIVPLDDARAAFPHLSATAKAHLKALSSSAKAQE